MTDNKIKKIKSIINKFYRLKDINNKAFVKIDGYWWELDVSTPINKATVRNLTSLGKMSDIDISLNQIVEAENYHKLDWVGTRILDAKYKTGWLDLDGNFYGCDYRCHKEQARILFNCSERDLEKKGFVKFASENAFLKSEKIIFIFGRDENYQIIKPTPRQRMFIMSSEAVNKDELKYLNFIGNELMY